MTAGDDHSASRRVDVLELEAPHLVAAGGELEAARRRARDAGAALKAAIGNGRVEHAETGTVADATWSLLDLLAEQLEERLGELERAERSAGRR